MLATLACLLGDAGDDRGASPFHDLLMLLAIGTAALLRGLRGRGL